MEREVISDKQGICIITLFVLGSTLVLGLGGEAKKDAWIAVILATIISVPMLMIYARLLFLFPQKDLFQILSFILGPVLGKAISLFFIWFAFHLGVLVLRNFLEFTSIMVLNQTPAIIPMTIYMILCIWGVKEGIEVIGRWTEFFIIIVLFLIAALTMVLSAPKMNISNLRPVLENGFSPVLRGAFSAFSFPFAETVVLMMCLSNVKSKQSVYKIYISGLIFASVIIVIVSMRNIMILGVGQLARAYFPSYIALSVVQIGEFIQRLEIATAIVLLICGYVKISICLLGVSRGVVDLFAVKDYRFIVTPIGALMLCMSIFIYSSTMEMKNWAFEVWPYYAFPFEVILPIIIWIIAELKMRKRKSIKRS